MPGWDHKLSSTRHQSLVLPGLGAKHSLSVPWPAKHAASVALLHGMHVTVVWGRCTYVVSLATFVQVRGQLNGFSQMRLCGHAFQQCTACSATVVQQHNQHGWEFLLRALRDPQSLEDLTGLTELHTSTAEKLDIASCSDDDVAGHDGAAKPKGAGSQAGDDDWTEL